MSNKDSDGALQTGWRALQTSADFDPDYLFAIYKFWSEHHQKDVFSIAGNALYKDDYGRICVLRLINDGSALEKTHRTIEMRAYDSYMKDLTTSPRKMALSDLFDSSIIGLYASDPVWSKRHMVKLPYQKNQQELFDDHERKSSITETSYDKWLYSSSFNYQTADDSKARLNIPLILPIRIWPLSRMGRC